MRNVYYIIILTLAINSGACFGVAFENPLQATDFVYSDNGVAKAITIAAETKQTRIKHAFVHVSGEGLREGLCPYVANLWLGNDLDQTNSRLHQLFTTDDTALQEKYRLNDPWCLAVNQQMYHIYYAFGTKGTLYPGRLYPKTQKAILDFLWQRMIYKNDIHLTRQSSWWMIGSENHDLVAKVSCLISSQIFMNEPRYKDRIYPDLGTGGGYDYWFHHMYGKGRVKGPQGRANHKDGKRYTAADHYHAWVDYFSGYFKQRAQKGFFLEVASPGYMAVSVSYLTDIYDLCDDKRLVAKTEQFLDLVWADWAQDQIGGVRGGGKTRASGHNHMNKARWADAMYKMSRFYFGGKGNAGSHFFTQLLSDYQPNPIIWHIALDRKGLGAFAYVSRRPGEEENKWPRPLGTERTMVCDTESRFVRYSWITPDYILGCQMDHPAAVHSHLSNQGRWQGITFSSHDGARVYPTALKKDENGNDIEDTSGYSRTLQHQNVMVVQQCRGYTQMNPDWFPSKNRADLPYGICFSGGLEKIVEKAGWLFVVHGDAYLAIRVVMGEYADGWQILVDGASGGETSALIEASYEWCADKHFLRIKDKYAGMIFEASTKADHATLEAFMADILDNMLVLDKTVVPGWHVLRYQGCGDAAKEMVFNLANNEIPYVGGKRMDYAPEMLFDSPYMKSKYNSGVIRISKDGQEMVLDFNE